MIKGSMVALVTPFTEDGSVNFKRVRELVEWHIQEGTDAILVLGTTAETPTLTTEEEDEIVRIAIEQNAGRVPIVVGSGSNNTAKAIETSLKYEKMGADALLVISPYYNKATQKGLIEHFARTAEAVKIPVILYNVPSRTGCNLLPATVMAIAERAKNVVAIKEASGDISQVAELAAISNGKIDIYSGNDDQIVPLLSLGGIGVISVLSNIAPKETHDMVMSYLDGDVKKSCEMQLKALDLVNALFCEVNPIPVKTALNLMGMEVGPLRLPLTPMEPQNEARLKKAMAEITNKEQLHGSLADVMKGKDVFIGVSAPGIVTSEMIATMSEDAICFAMANPTPEIMPEEAKKGGARVIATGRSDYPNQINNVLVFPGIFRGALDARAKDITEEMKVAAVHAIASIVSEEELCEEYIIPGAFDKRVAKAVAKAVGDAWKSKSCIM